jgi:hypothetical protein
MLDVVKETELAEGHHEVGVPGGVGHHEFDNAATHSFLVQHAILLRLSCLYTSQQNGRVEHVLRTHSTTTCIPCCSRPIFLLSFGLRR